MLTADGVGFLTVLIATFCCEVGVYEGCFAVHFRGIPEESVFIRRAEVNDDGLFAAIFRVIHPMCCILSLII